MPSKAAKSWLPIAISTLALIVSVYAVYVTTQARKDARAVAGLDLRPVVRLHSVFRKIKNTPPHFVVTNVGPVEIVQLEIQPISYRAARRDKKFILTSWGSENRRIVERLPPLATISFPFSDHWLNVNARLGKPLEYNVMEMRLTYRRPPDMLQFVEGAFYFVNPEGVWVSENDSSLTPEIYDPIKEDVFRFANRKWEIRAGHKLHPIEPQE